MCMRYIALQIWGGIEAMVIEVRMHCRYGGEGRGGTDIEIIEVRVFYYRLEF